MVVSIAKEANLGFGGKSMHSIYTRNRSCNRAREVEKEDGKEMES